MLLIMLPSPISVFVQTLRSAWQTSEKKKKRFTIGLQIYSSFTLDSCMDKNGNCPAWKQYGHCQNSPDIMKEHCSYTCNFCNGK